MSSCIAACTPPGCVKSHRLGKEAGSCLSATRHTVPVLAVAGVPAGKTPAAAEQAAAVSTGLKSWLDAAPY